MSSTRMQVFDRVRFGIEKQIAGPSSLQVWSQTPYEVWRAVSLPLEEILAPRLTNGTPYVSSIKDQIEDQAREDFNMENRIARQIEEEPMYKVAKAIWLPHKQLWNTWYDRAHRRLKRVEGLTWSQAWDQRKDGSE